jgi:uncharacterized protein (UPF0332 family)
MLTKEDRTEIVKYRIEKAQRAYGEAVGCIGMQFVEAAANRLYYAAYYAVSALLIASGYEAKSHDGIASLFVMAFVKSGKIDVSYSKIYHRLRSLRLTGDYQDRRNLDLEEDIKPLVEPAKELITLVSSMAEAFLE